jgi:hypothetical protein
MVKNFENWSTDDSRQYGDTGIVESDYGYHIMYFVSDLPEYLYECQEAVISEKEEEYISATEVKQHKIAMSKTTVATVSTDSEDTDD